MVPHRLRLCFSVLLLAMTACSSPAGKGNALRENGTAGGHVPPEMVGHWVMPVSGASGSSSYVFNGDGTYVELTDLKDPSGCGRELSITVKGNADFGRGTVTLTPTSGEIVSGWCGGSYETKPAKLERRAMTWSRVDEGDRPALVLDGDRYRLIR